MILKEDYSMKKNVHYALLEDIQKYIPDDEMEKVFPFGFEVTYDGKTDQSVITFLRDYYNSHLPVDLTAWARVNEPSETLIYGKELGPQLCFIRDQLATIFYNSWNYYEKDPVMVISTHMSKSVTLPVYRLYVTKYNLEIIIRANFYNWIISINSEKPLDFDCMELFDTNRFIPYYYCEGFPKSNCYGSYENNHSRFTVDITSKYDVYTFFYLLNNCLKNRNKE